MASSAGPCKRKKSGHHGLVLNRHLNFQPTITPRRMPHHLSHPQTLSHIIAHLMPTQELGDQCPGGLWAGGRTSKRNKKVAFFLPPPTRMHRSTPLNALLFLARCVPANGTVWHGLAPRWSPHPCSGGTSIRSNEYFRVISPSF